MKLRIALLAFGAVTLAGCSTVPQENCFARLAEVPKAEDGTTFMDPNDEGVFGLYTCRQHSALRVLL